MGSSLLVRLDPVLATLLGRRYRGRNAIAYPLDRRASIKDIIESLQIPHTEVAAITANGNEQTFSWIPQAGQEAILRGVAPGFDIFAENSLRPPFPGPLRFVADINVGRLGRLLRLAGLDTRTADGDDRKTVERAVAENRIVLSRNRDLLRRSGITWGHLVRAKDPELQLAETLLLYDLAARLRPFSRCLECNALLEPVEKEDILHRLLPLTKKYYHRFMICPACDRIFWQGSHHARMRRTLERAVGRMAEAEALFSAPPVP